MIRRSSSQDSLSSDEGHVLKVRIGPATRTSEDRGDSVRVSRIQATSWAAFWVGPWSPGDKEGFGTARAAASKVWYTLNDGALSEVFFPRIDTPATRDTLLAVSDGATFADREDTGTTHQVALPDTRSLVYRQVNTARSGNYRITKTYTTDPARSAVLVDIRFESLDGRPYSVYVLHDAGLGLNANDDMGWSAGVAWSPPTGS
jgi:hypothetical protein